MPSGLRYHAPIVRLLRPHFAVIGLILFVVGALYASALGAAPAPAAVAGAYICMLVGHLAVHAVNDYFDREDDRHGTPTPFSGGSGVLQAYPRLAPTAPGLAIGLSASRSSPRGKKRGDMLRARAAPAAPPARAAKR